MGIFSATASNLNQVPQKLCCIHLCSSYGRLRTLLTPNITLVVSNDGVYMGLLFLVFSAGSAGGGGGGGRGAS